MNFWTGLALLGEAFINAGIDSGVKMRDLGVSLYETEASNIDQYTFDVDGDIFPVGFTSPNLAGNPPLTMSAQNWDSGSHNALFFQSNYAEEPCSVDRLPVSAPSLYLGRHSGAKGTNSYVEQNWDSYAANVAALGNNYPDFDYPVYPERGVRHLQRQWQPDRWDGSAEVDGVSDRKQWLAGIAAGRGHCVWHIRRQQHLDHAQ